MEYNNIFKEFIALFPEDKEWFENEVVNNDACEEDGMHVVFGMVVVPYLLNIATASNDKLKKAFDYIEKMESSGNSMIAEVVEFSVLENLIGEDSNMLKQLYEYMGPETKSAFKDVCKWFNN